MARRKLLRGLRAESLSDQVYRLLREAIANGELRPGERILEKELAARWGISRTPVREALLRLETEGVVICNSRRSYNVAVLTVADVRDIYRTLAVLEGAAAAWAAPQIRPAELAALERFNRAMQQAARRGDLRDFGRWNRRFHDVFLERVGNRILHQTCDRIRALLYTFPVRPDSLRQWLEKSVAEHREIIRLLRAGQADRVGRYFRDVHWSFERNRQFIQDAFDRQGEAAVHLW
jgi:DNA-binding GntR family transcriptional regulator